MSRTGLPPTQRNTAPVVEYRCLYTHDVRRKSKRWQDGFVKFHTFNKRIMVYDIPRNFIGDMHWKESGELQEGDEITLESAVLVQVNEPIERTETDLTPLFEKRDKNVSKKPAGTPDRNRRLGALQHSRRGTPSHVRHKALNALLGGSRRPHGRAMLPTRSPYDLALSDTEKDWPDGPPSKRKKIDATTEARGVEQTIKTPRKREIPPRSPTRDNLRRNPSSPRKREERSAAPMKWQARPDVQEVIEISSGTEHHPSSDGSGPGPTMPPPPSRKTQPKQALRPAAISQPRSLPTVIRTANKRSSEAAAPVRPSSPPVSLVNKISNVEQPPTPTELKAANNNDPQSERPAGKPLKFSKKVSRNMLLCQDVPRKGAASKAVGIDPICKENDQSSTRKQDTRIHQNPQEPPAAEKTEHDRLQERIGQIGKTKRQPNAGSSSPSVVTCGAQHPSHTLTDGSIFSSISTSDLAVHPAHIDPESCHAERESHDPKQGERFGNDVTTSELEGIRPATAIAKSEQVRARVAVEATVLKRPFQTTKTMAGRGKGVNSRKTDKNQVTGGWERQQEASVKDGDLGPWSTEAWDLFDWRPPGRLADGNKIEVAAGG